MTTTTPTLAEQAAAAQAEANRLRAEADRIDAAGRAAADQAMLEHYRNAATERAREYHEHRDGLKTKLDELAMADKLDLDKLFAAFIALRDDDARCGALNTHSSMLNTLEPPERNHIGVQPMPRGAQVAELYKGLSFAGFVDQLVARRADAIRARHVEELRAQAHTQVQAAEQAARTAAGGST
jgi:hypothetical protein